MNRPPNWRHSAACRDTDPDLFFRDEDEADAIAVCRPCPVRIRCLEYALSRPGQHGVFGGVPAERRAALRHALLKRQQRGRRAA